MYIAILLPLMNSVVHVCLQFMHTGVFVMKELLWAVWTDMPSKDAVEIVKRWDLEI